MILQLNPPLPMVSPKGKCLCHFLIDYGPEHHLEWVCFQEDGEVWTYKNPEIRSQENVTEGRLVPPAGYHHSECVCSICMRTKEKQ
jgi:hypothetical protein